MKTVFTFLAVAFIVLSVSGQSPEKISYQAVIRNSSDQLITEQGVGMKVSILLGVTDGTPVYVESHSVTTNVNGLVTLEIGTGTSTDDFSAIDWGNGTYFIKTETDPASAGGTNYSITGVSQLLSVPYALHAKTAESVSGGSGGAHYVGELFGGGIVFWVDHTGEHGLIASLVDLDGGSGVAWVSAAYQNTEIGESAQSYYDGAANTAAIIAQDATEGYAATLCDSYVADGYSDWYLPSERELYLLGVQDYIISKVLNNDGDANTNGLSLGMMVGHQWIRYWSSTEFVSGTEILANTFSISTNNHGFAFKDGIFRVRAIRVF